MAKQYSLAMHLELLLLLHSWLTVASIAQVNQTQTKPGCQPKCGNITVPYPFGIGAKCSIAKWAKINCSTAFTPPKPFTGEHEVMEFSPTEIRIKNHIAMSCNNQTGGLIASDIARVDLRGTPYTFSSTKNKFTAIGCDTLSALSGPNSTTLCASVCERKEDVIEGSCFGSGCCQASIPKGLKIIDVEIASFDNLTKVSSFALCSAALLAEEDRYYFRISDFTHLTHLRDIPIVLDFAVVNQTCKRAKQDPATFACRGNSSCYDTVDGSGYFCNCHNGYEGNPYLDQGCLDVNECADPNNNPCKGMCINTDGSYECSCPSDSYGDGTKNGNGCTKKTKKFPVLQLTLGFGLGFLFLLVSGSWLYMIVKKRRLFNLKEKFFQQNGGLLLKERISSNEGSESTKIFTSEELKIATNNYAEHRILGQGGYGTVYKGVLPDLKVVAIKKSKIFDASQLGQFINEVVILTQINHRNVVKLLGCCLETEVPMLVYEFVSNGTLFHHLHAKNGTISSLSWEDRLRIAAEIAGALAYLHSAASIPIIHRDVKSANILLDDNYTAKVADFGASRLNPLDETQISTLVQGTMGYLDPEYFHTGQLTEKSDVYSFGVLLAELLTGEKPLCFQRSQEQRNLATYFIVSIKENRLFELLETEIVNGGHAEKVHAVAQLAKRCLCITSEPRPSMKEVAAELEGLRGFQKHAWVKTSNGKTGSLSSEHDMDLYAISSSSYSTGAATSYYRLKNDMEQSMNIPR